MSDRCPLGTGLYWECEGDIPEICKEHCEAIWEEVARGPARIDIFNADCMNVCDIEYGDHAIQRFGEDNMRQYSILQMCMQHSGVEMYAEEWTFGCPNN